MRGKPHPPPFDARDLLGLPRAKAEKTAEEHGCRSRVLYIDGQFQGATADLNLARIDLSIDQSLVTDVSVG